MNDESDCWSKLVMQKTTLASLARTAERCIDMNNAERHRKIGDGMHALGTRQFCQCHQDLIEVYEKCDKSDKIVGPKVRPSQCSVACDATLSQSIILRDQWRLTLIVPGWS